MLKFGNKKNDSIKSRFLYSVRCLCIQSGYLLLNGNLSDKLHIIESNLNKVNSFS
jgi:hypothetical protein